MENIKSCELCLNQIIKTEDFENLHYDEKQNLKILKNLDITVSKDAKICSNCVNVSDLTYNFKMSCLTNNDHLKTLIRPGIKDKLILEEVVVEETKSEFKNEKKVCRFCLNFSEVNSLMEVNLEQDVVLKDMLQRCLPEIDTNMVQNPLICSICSKLLEKLFNFFSQCKDSEVLRNLDRKTDVLVNENMPTVANNDDNIGNSFVKEEHCEGIENPELQIKSENFDVDEDIKDSINDSNCLLNEREIQKEPSSFSSDLFRCKLCFHKADSRMSLLTHQQSHSKTRKSTISKLYKCTECSFQSKYQGNLIRHKKDCKKPYGNCEEEKVELYKCNRCIFTASNKREIVKHKKKDHKERKRCLGNPVEEKDVKPKPHGKIKEKKFVCDLCSYRTTFNSHLKQHYLVHKEPREVNLFKCDYCSFATKWKDSLRVHAMRHKKPSELPNNEWKQPAKSDQNLRKVGQHNPVEEKDVKLKPRGKIKEKKFLCDICSYQTAFNSCLKKHYIIHKEPSEANLFKCDYCSFATKWKGSLRVHAMRHKNPSELPNNEWKQPAKTDENLKKVGQHNPLEEKDVKPKPCGKIKERKFVCDKCSYQTTFNSHLKQHYLIHKEPWEVNLFKCDYCAYATNYKSNIKKHTIRHKNPSELPKFKCYDCPYETIRKRNLVSHVLVHKTRVCI